MKIKTILGEDLKPVIILEDLKDLEELARRWKQEIWETNHAYYVLTPNYIWKVYKKTGKIIVADKAMRESLSHKEATDKASWPVEYEVTVSA